MAEEALACKQQYGFNSITLFPVNLCGPGDNFDPESSHVIPALIKKVMTQLIIMIHKIPVWGDGLQTRSYCFIDDCVEGIYRIMQTNHYEPINLGQDRMLTINELVDIIANIAGKKISKQYDLTKPQGVRGRNSDNTKLREVLKWEPQIPSKRG